jgi:hypothetical protein
LLCGLSGDLQKDVKKANIRLKNTYLIPKMLIEENEDYTAVKKKLAFKHFRIKEEKE